MQWYWDLTLSDLFLGIEVCLISELSSTNVSSLFYPTVRHWPLTSKIHITIARAHYLLAVKSTEAYLLSHTYHTFVRLRPPRQWDKDEEDPHWRYQLSDWHLHSPQTPAYHESLKNIRATDPIRKFLSRTIRPDPIRKLWGKVGSI